MPVSVWILIVALVAAVAAWRLGRIWWKYRGKRVIVCPENHTPAGVVVDAGHASATALHGAPELRLASCSRWPERAGCGQECLAQIHAAPEDCLVRNVVSRWFVGKKCSNCGRPFGEIAWAGSPPALLGADKKTVEWRDVSADRIYETLAVSLPVCYACHTAMTMIREHPDLVVDRHRPPN
jgi:hypothetical protein